MHILSMIKGVIQPFTQKKKNLKRNNPQPGLLCERGPAVPLEGKTAFCIGSDFQSILLHILHGNCGAESCTVN